MTVAGKPLTVGWITFYPDETKGNKSSHLPLAEIKNDGTYERMTNNKPGAAPGAYKVVVATTQDTIPLRPVWNKDGTPWQPRWLTHVKFTTPDTADLRIEVLDKRPPGIYDLRLSK